MRKVLASCHHNEEEISQHLKKKDISGNIEKKLAGPN